MLLQISYIGFISAIFLKNSEKYSKFVACDNIFGKIFRKI